MDENPKTDDMNDEEDSLDEEDEEDEDEEEEEEEEEEDEREERPPLFKSGKKKDRKQGPFQPRLINQHLVQKKRIDERKEIPNPIRGYKVEVVSQGRYHQAQNTRMPFKQQQRKEGSHSRHN